MLNCVEQFFVFAKHSKLNFVALSYGFLVQLSRSAVKQ